MTDRARGELVLWIPVAAATASLAWIVPELPLVHLDDPSHWGVIGYLGFVGILARRVTVGRLGLPRSLLALFLAGMPLIYVANWVRFGGTTGWLVVELLGLVLFSVIAWLGRSRAAWWLAAGVAGHALWDAGHLGGPSFVPDWYATGCAIVDIALGGLTAGIFLSSTKSGAGRQRASG